MGHGGVRLHSIPNRDWVILHNIQSGSGYLYWKPQLNMGTQTHMAVFLNFSQGREAIHLQKKKKKKNFPKPIQLHTAS